MKIFGQPIITDELDAFLLTMAASGLLALFLFVLGWLSGLYEVLR